LPSLNESRETAAEENATAYFPLLDRVAQGYFDDKRTEQHLYTAFVQLLRTDGHITAPEALASFDLALSVRSAAPRIEAHYQFYTTSVEPSLLAEQAGDCDIWVSFHGKQYCSPYLEASFGPIRSERYAYIDNRGYRVADRQIEHMSCLLIAYSATVLRSQPLSTPTSHSPNSKNGTRP